MLGKRALFEYEEDTYLCVTKTATWPIKMRSEHSIERIMAQAFTTVYNVVAKYFVDYHGDNPNFNEIVHLKRTELKSIAADTLALTYNRKFTKQPSNRRFFCQLSSNSPSNVLCHEREVSRQIS